MVQKKKSDAREKKVLSTARKTLKNDALDAKIGVDIAVTEPGKGSEIF